VTETHKMEEDLTTYKLLYIIQVVTFWVMTP